MAHDLTLWVGTEDLTVRANPNGTVTICVEDTCHYPLRADDAVEFASAVIPQTHAVVDRARFERLRAFAIEVCDRGDAPGEAAPLESGDLDPLP